MAEDEVRPLPTAKEIMDALENVLVFQNLKEILRNGGTIAVHKDGMLCGKAPTDEAIQIFVLELYREILLYHRLPYIGCTFKNEEGV